MAIGRTLAAGELFKEVTYCRVIREQTGTHGDTVTTEAILGDGTETAFDVDSASNFTAADTCIISGSGGVEAVIIGTPATTMPVTPPPLLAQDTGALFLEATIVDLGKIAQDSISWTSTSALTPVFEEVGRGVVVYLPGTIEFSVSFGLYGINVPNIQFVNGYLEAETGDGAAYATASQGAIGEINQTTQGVQIMRLRGVRHDSKNIELDFCNAYIEAAVNASAQRSAPMQLNCTAKASTLICRVWA